MEWVYSEELGAWTGLSTVTKPALKITDRNNLAYEYDTKDTYVFDGTNWLPL